MAAIVAALVLVNVALVLRELQRGGSSPAPGVGRLHVALFLLCLALVTAPQAYRSYRAADGLPYTWTTSKVWLASAECAKETLKFLVLCRDGQVVPIADGFGGDDLGHALALEIYSATTQVTVQPEQISRLNTTLNYAAMVALALLLMTSGLRVAALAMLMGGTLIANNLHALTPHPAQFAAACFAALLPIAILGRPRCRAAWMAAGFFALGLALLLREAIGMMGVLTSLIAAALLFVRQRTVAPVLLALAIVATSATPFLLLRARDVAYQLPPPEKLESHGAFANLYMGLGAVPNPFGIAWSDFSAIDAVKAIDPSVAYLSPRFYEILQARYFEIVRDSPAEVTSIYLAKLMVTLRTEMPGLPFRPVLWLALLVIVAAGALVRRGRRFDAAADSCDAVLVACASLAGAFVAQAVLISFDMQYLFPAQIFLLLAMAAIVDMMLPVRKLPRAAAKSPGAAGS
ncbi:hypothetical protein IVB34_21595 [Bradyrhizobium sp. 2]|uniref:hypothetical protein n=1 Tax=Bradyrhizobium sp. 2 TaxID=190045 RepID=UPI001FFBF3A3|nr:hypothetical protein [Bradyrhizobium sp. 2]MCK1460881.1 hypothetical protein [Bradyrhizobium sp. 2]